LRDPEANRCVGLPIAGREALVEGLTREQWAKAQSAAPRRGFAWLAGQPEEIARAYYEAMGGD
jgi:hypothetical protein